MGIRPQDAALPQPLNDPECHPNNPVFGLGMFHKLHHLWSKDEPVDDDTPDEPPDVVSWPDNPPPKSKRIWPAEPVPVALPRQDTLTPRNFEDAERISSRSSGNIAQRPVRHSLHQSMSLPRCRASSTPPCHWTRTSAPDITISASGQDPNGPELPAFSSATHPQQYSTLTNRGIEETSRPSRSPSLASSLDSHSDSFSDAESKAQLNAELDTRWILNLSMHFRDKTDREKFFVTYAESPSKWRRVTISCYYRNAEPGSLEADLTQLQLQRDKNLMIYESIRDSLPEIQFYDTVTNLKLETRDSRLHVHVTEDVNEIIPYPPRSTVAHLLEDLDDQSRPRQVRESELEFESHLSGFVYKVNCHGKTWIKKEIPGPDTVDEFLYEINALHALRESSRVIRLEAIVLDDSLSLVKGLLISYAERGAIVDLLYDHKGKIPLDQRLGWARDAIIGLSDIHQEGYVQGDFTLSNIVVDSEGNAKIIDINRRGCPVGWEPPEIRAKIQSHQRIFMYIGEKSDLYQLGITLWGLAADDDEPERHDPPLLATGLPDEVPAWYKEIVRICLSEQPRDRWSAKDLIKLFPDDLAVSTRDSSHPSTYGIGFRRPKQYIDPSAAVEREDIDQFRRQSPPDGTLAYSPQSSRDDYTFTYPRSSDYDRGSATSAGERPRGRRPPANTEHLAHHERRPWSTDEPHCPASSVPEDDDDVNILEIVPGKHLNYEEIELDGKPFLIARNTFSDEDMKVLEHRPTAYASENVSGSSNLELPVEEKAIQSDLVPHDRNTSSFAPLICEQNNSNGISPNSHAHGVKKSAKAVPQSSTGNQSNPQSSPQNLTAVCLDSHDSSNEQCCSNLSQPPARLQYSDSGVHEPLHLDGEVEQPEFHQPNNQSLRQSQNPDVLSSYISETSEQDPVSNSGTTEPSAGSFDPPPLQRSETAFKVGFGAGPLLAMNAPSNTGSDHDDSFLSRATPDSQAATDSMTTSPSPVKASALAENA